MEPVCVCACVRARHRHWCGFKMLALFVFEQIYHCGFFSESGSGSSTVLFNTAMEGIHLHCAHWLCIPNRMCACVCRCVRLGHISLSSSTLELLFDERVIPALIESRCSLSPFNGLPVIIRSFFGASKNSELYSSPCLGAYRLSQC